MMDYATVCSGIEAVSVAVEPYGFKPQWFSEIEPAPCAVLDHYWPHVPNHGDMTMLAGRVLGRSIPAPSLLWASTPCQSFSVAGMRKGLLDERGQLTIATVRLLDAIDFIRQRRGDEPAVLAWENVTGALSDENNAFGAYLAALAGESEALEPGPRPERGKSSQFWRWDKKRNQHVPRWPVGGHVAGPTRTVAWRVLDAQFFGLAQRRKRVFVVASARKGFDPGAVLFEPESVRRAAPPSREPKEKSSNPDANGFAIPILEAGARTGKSTTDPRAGIGIGKNGEPMFTLQAGKQHAVCAADERTVSTGQDTIGQRDPTGETQEPAHTAFGGGNCSGDIDVAATLTAKGQRIDFEVETFAVHGTQGPDVLRDLANSGQENAINTAPLYRVRRLMPVEAERLQGFEDGFTAIPYRGGIMADGPRYKMLGNSLAVPCVRWLLLRIAEACGESSWKADIEAGRL